jgi:hypothetical protein
MRDRIKCDLELESNVGMNNDKNMTATMSIGKLFKVLVELSKVREKASSFF